MADEIKPTPKGRGKKTEETPDVPPTPETPAATGSIIGSGDPKMRFTTQPDGDDLGVYDVTKGVSERTETTRLELEAQPRIRFYLPLTPGESPLSKEFVSINGYSVEISKGKMVDLPEQIVKMLAEMYNIELDPAKGIVGQNGQPINLASADKKTQETLS